MNKLCKSYADLKEKAIDSSNRNGKFDITPLKELFRSEINSERTYSQINDLFSLITTLEKRAVLSPKNIDTFEIIFNALNLSLDTLNKHKSLIDHRAEGFSKSAVANNRSEPIPSALNDRSKTANVQHKLSDEGLCYSSEESKCKKRKETSIENINKPKSAEAENANKENIVTQPLASPNEYDQLNNSNPTARHFSTDESHPSIHRGWLTKFSGAFLRAKDLAANYLNYKLLVLLLFVTLVCNEGTEDIAVIAVRLCVWYQLAKFVYFNHTTILHLISNVINLINVVFQTLVWILKLLYKLLELLQLWSSNNSSNRSPRGRRHLERKNNDTGTVILAFIAVSLFFLKMADHDNAIQGKHGDRDN